MGIFKKLNSSRVWLDREITAFARQLPEGARVLDAGAGKQPYRSRFAHCRYESADFEKVDKAYAKSTYVCDLARIPVPDNSFDAVIFSQVMEHLPEPLAVLQELHRILKPGGRLFYTGPLWYEEHEQPYDFYRYTQFALRHLFDKAAYEVEDLRWLEGYLATASWQLRKMAGALPLSFTAYGGRVTSVPTFCLALLFKPFAHLLAYSFARADRQARYTATGYPINYLAIVRRPA